MVDSGQLRYVESETKDKEALLYRIKYRPAANCLVGKLEKTNGI